MADTKFTPGPWKWDEAAGCFILNSNGEIVAEIDCCKGNRGDGPLIAAAPDMYEALEEIIAMNRQHAEDEYGDAERAEAWAYVTLARAALAKARP